MVAELPENIEDARDGAELRRLLVIRPGMGEVAPAVAVELFERHHGGGQPDAVDTALLLGTDWRWRRTSANVLAGILRTHILDEAEQDELADRLLWSPQIRYVHPPLGDQAVEPGKQTARQDQVVECLVVAA